MKNLVRFLGIFFCVTGLMILFLQPTYNVTGAVIDIKSEIGRTGLLMGIGFVLVGILIFTSATSLKIKPKVNLRERMAAYEKKIAEEITALN